MFSLMRYNKNDAVYSKIRSKDMDKQTEELIVELQKAAQEYYHKESRTMTDEDYDNKIEYLRHLASEDDQLLEDKRVFDLLEGSVSGGTLPEVSESELVTHEIQMGSLAKAQNKNELKTYFDKTTAVGATGYKLQAKLDGVAIEVVYKNGYPVEMSTRGDGFVGQNVSYLINHEELAIVGIPSKLENLSNCSLRGELFVRYSQLESIEKNRKQAGIEKPFSLPRMAISGMITKAKDGLGYEAEATFCVYGAYNDNGDVMELDQDIAKEKDLVSVNSLTRKEYAEAGGEGKLICQANYDKMFDLIDRFAEVRDRLDIPTDGAVLRPLNESYVNKIMGSTSRAPLAFIAYKYPAETVTTKVVDMIYTTGKTGKITPKAVVERVLVDGSYIENATCHNFNWLHEKDIRIGSIVAINKANDIIPAIVTVIEKGDGNVIQPLTNCPSCGEELSGDGLDYPKSLECTNIKCPSRVYFLMKGIVGKQGLDIDGLSNVSLDALCNTEKVKDVADFFKLTEDDLSELIIGETPKGKPKKLGKVRARKMIKRIESARTNTPAYKLLNTFGYLGFGSSICKVLLSEFKGIKEVVNATEEDLLKVDGFSEKRASVIVENRDRVNEVINKLEKENVILDNGLGSEPVEKTGKKYCISGSVPKAFANRNDFVEYMDKLGHTFVSSVSKNTDVLFWDGVKNSSKVEKANKLNVQLRNPEDYDKI